MQEKWPTILDTLDDSNEIIPVSSNMKPFEIMIVFGGKERQLAGSAYNTRVDECKQRRMRYRLMQVWIMVIIKIHI